MATADSVDLAATFGPRALVVDWGGVLTNSLDSVMETWTMSEGFLPEDFAAVMSRWFGAQPSFNPVSVLERGEIEVPDFERQLAEELTARTGQQIASSGLLARLFYHFEHAADMTALVRRAKARGITTALLSNSWGDHYPDHLFDGMFDQVIISGQVGMRKPDPEIFLYTLRKLEIPARQSVFVDDLIHNVTAASSLGMIGVHHRDYQSTAAELSILFDMELDN